MVYFLLYTNWETQRKGLQMTSISGVQRTLLFLMDREDGINAQSLHAMCKGDMDVLHTWIDMCNSGELVEPVESREGLIRWRTKNGNWKKEY